MRNMSAAGTEARPTGFTSPAHDDAPLQRVNAPRSFLRGFWQTVGEVWDYRELLGNLVRKELKVKYKDSVLGFFWSLLLPLFQLAVYWLVMGQFLNAGVIPVYGVFIFSGLAVWTLFSEILTSATGSIVYNAGLVKKVYFPRELFPLAAVGAALVNFLFQLVILLGAVVVAGFTTDQWPNLMYLPAPILGLIVLVLFGTAFGMLLASANVYLRDIQHLITIVMMLWFWITPIIYDVGRVSGKLPKVLFDIYLWNPMAPVVLSFQKFFWPQGNGTQFDFDGSVYGRLGVLIVVGLALVWFAQRVFAKAQGNFAQEL
jgi:ABC-2 type transport system permease protein